MNIFSRLGCWIMATLRGSEDGTEVGTLHVLRTDSAGRLQVSLLSADMVLADLADVDAALAPVTGDMLGYDGYQWTAVEQGLADLADVDAALAPVTGDMLVYDGYQWAAASEPQENTFFVPATVAHDTTNNKTVACHDPYSLGVPFNIDVLTYHISTWYAPRAGTVQVSAIVYVPNAAGDIIADFGLREAVLGSAPSAFSSVGVSVSAMAEYTIVAYDDIEVETGSIVNAFFSRSGDAVADTFPYAIDLVGFLIEYL